MKSVPKPSFKQKLWSSLKDVVLILLKDIILFMIVLAALAFAYLGIAGLKAPGMAPERCQVLEIMHFYGYMAVLCIFLLDMVLKTILEVFKKRS